MKLCFFKVAKLDVCMYKSLFVTGFMKTLHISMQVLAHFRYLKSHNSTTTNCSSYYESLLLYGHKLPLHFDTTQLRIAKSINASHRFVRQCKSLSSTCDGQTLVQYEVSCRWCLTPVVSNIWSVAMTTVVYLNRNLISLIQYV